METLVGAASIGGTGTVTVSRNRTPYHPQWVRPMRRSKSLTQQYMIWLAKLHAFCTARSHVPSTSASIPSRYQTFFYSSGENKGFNSQATRFADHLETVSIDHLETIETKSNLPPILIVRARV